MCSLGEEGSAQNLTTGNAFGRQRHTCRGHIRCCWRCSCEESAKYIASVLPHPNGEAQVRGSPCNTYQSGTESYSPHYQLPPQRGWRCSGTWCKHDPGATATRQHLASIEGQMPCHAQSAIPGLSAGDATAKEKRLLQPLSPRTLK